MLSPRPTFSPLFFPPASGFVFLGQLWVSMSGYLAPSFLEFLQLLHSLLLLISCLLFPHLPGLGLLSQHLWKTRAIDPSIPLLYLVNFFFLKLHSYYLLPL